MALTKDRTLRVISGGPTSRKRQQVKAASILYNGAFCAADPANGGVVRKVGTASDVFVGINVSGKADNSASGAADGDVYVELVTQGELQRHAVTGASTVADVGKKVYASADDTLTLTASTNPEVGRISGFNTDDSTFDISFCAITHAPIS